MSSLLPKFLPISKGISNNEFFTKKTVVQKETVIILSNVLKQNTTYCIVFPMFLTVLMLLLLIYPSHEMKTRFS